MLCTVLTARCPPRPKFLKFFFFHNISGSRFFFFVYSFFFFNLRSADQVGVGYPESFSFPVVHRRFKSKSWNY